LLGANLTKSFGFCLLGTSIIAKNKGEELFPSPYKYLIPTNLPKCGTAKKSKHGKHGESKENKK